MMDQQEEEENQQEQRCCAPVQQYSSSSVVFLFFLLCFWRRVHTTAVCTYIRICCCTPRILQSTAVVYEMHVRFQISCFIFHTAVGVPVCTGILRILLYIIYSISSLEPTTGSCGIISLQCSLRGVFLLISYYTHDILRSIRLPSK